MSKLFTITNSFTYSVCIAVSIPLLYGAPIMARMARTKTKASDTLKTYRAKRDLTKSPEPEGIKSSKKSGNIFVIHKHAASHLHYDLRFAFDGVLKSWAIPKGPSLNPSDKRLAVQTEDHPMDYKYFEGVIPEGSYGAGTVMVWDYGTYENIKQKDGKLVPIKQCLHDGTLELFFHGEKIQGGYALVRMKGAESKDWLFIKMHDDYASTRKNPVNTKNKSVKSGLTMTQITRKKKA